MKYRFRISLNGWPWAGLLGHADEAAVVALLNHDLTAFGAAAADARLMSDMDAPAGLCTLREGSTP